MQGIEINKENMQYAFASIPSNTPIVMLNLLRYKADAGYDKNSAAPFATGREAYFKGYIPAFNKLAANAGVQPLYIGEAMVNLVAKADEKWDNIALIAYPDFETFRSIIEHPDYSTFAAPHRLAALEDWRLIVSVKTTIV